MVEHGWSRAVRAALFAVVCVLLTALGHVLMSGDSLPWWTVAGAFVGVWTCGWWLAAYERDVASVTAVAVAAQAVLHGGFSLAAMASSAHPQMTMAEMSPVPHGHQMTLGPMLGMFAVHLVMGLLSGLWLAYGERAVFGAIRCAAQRVRASLTLVDRVPAPLGLLRVNRSRVFRVPAMRQWRLVHVIVSRGPPAGVAVS